MSEKRNENMDKLSANMRSLSENESARSESYRMAAMRSRRHPSLSDYDGDNYDDWEASSARYMARYRHITGAY